MQLSFFKDNGQFIPYNTEHLLAILATLLIGVCLIVYSKQKLTASSQKKLVLGLAILAACAQLAKVAIRLYLGNFDKTEDLPLHLCNILPFLLLSAYLFNSRKFWAILYFWIMAGTFQSLITPTLTESFPHYEYFRYWVVHCGLVIAVLYPIFVWGHKIVKKDILYGWIGINVLAFSMVPVNLLLGSNYMYMQGKPSGTTMYDLLGPWPWYILSLELVSLILFTILYLPFHFTGAKKES